MTTSDFAASTPAILGLSGLNQSETEEIVAKFEDLVADELKKYRNECLFWRVGEPRRIIGIRYGVKSFGNVSCANSTFDLAFEIWTTWQISERDLDLYIESRKADEKWVPSWVPPCEYFNAASTPDMSWLPLSGSTREDTFKLESHDYEGQKIAVGLGCRMVRGTFVEQMELKAFPFDTQYLKLWHFSRYDDSMNFAEFESLKKIDPTFEHKQKQNGRFVEFAHEAGSMNWETNNMPEEVGVPEQDNTRVWYLKEDPCMLYFAIAIYRHWQYYFWKVMFVLDLLALITIPVTSFGSDNFPDQMGYLATVLLATVAYLYVIGENIPQLKYLTRIDYFVYGVFLFIILAVAEVYFVFKFVDEEKQEDVSDTLTLINITVWVVGNLIYFLDAYRIRKLEMNKFNEEEDMGWTKLCVWGDLMEDPKAKVYSLYKTGVKDTIEGKGMVLVKKGSINSIKWPKALKTSTEPVPLIFNGDDGKLALSPNTEKYEEGWGYKWFVSKITADVEKAFKATFNDVWVKLETEGQVFVFDLTMGKFESGTPVNFVVDKEPEDTMNPDFKNRQFVINEDMTISPKYCQKYVLGYFYKREPPEEEQAGGEEAPIFQDRTQEEMMEMVRDVPSTYGEHNRDVATPSEKRLPETQPE